MRLVRMSTAVLLALLTACSVKTQPPVQTRSPVTLSDADFLRLLTQDAVARMDSGIRRSAANQGNQDMLRQAFGPDTVEPRTAAILSVNSKEPKALADVLVSLQNAMENRTRNLANAKTDAYKRIVTKFSSDGRSLITTCDMTQGSAIQTGGNLDLSVQGAGFFPLTGMHGELTYTRCGMFSIDPHGVMVLNSNEGFHLNPPVVLPSNVTTITFASNGRLTCTVAGQTTPTSIGQIQLACFAHPDELASADGIFFTPTFASGPATLANPGDRGTGTVHQGFVEGSNVKEAEEYMGIWTLRRTYDLVFDPLLSGRP